MIYEKKVTPFKSPDLDKLQAMVIDLRTRIYIAIGADVEEAKNDISQEMNYPAAKQRGIPKE
jgi:hypothetical protein